MASTLNTLYPQEKEVLPNLFYLGRGGVKVICGVTVAYLSGGQTATSTLSRTLNVPRSSTELKISTVFAKRSCATSPLISS